MAEYQSYTDVNQVKWTIYESANTLGAYVSDDNEGAVYVPTPADLSTVITTQGDETRQEVVRTAFARLREKIDAYAKEHQNQVALRVKASPGGGGGLLLLLLLLLAAG